MIEGIDAVLTIPYPRSAGFLTADAEREAVEMLTEALAPVWTVYKETDYQGEVSIIALPADDNDVPAFILFEKNGRPHMAKVRGDEWESEESCASVEAAIAGIIAQTLRLAIEMEAAV